MAIRYHVGNDWFRASYETIYHKVIVCQFSCFCHKYILRYSDIIDIQDGHLKIQDGGQVSCRYQLHMNPYIEKSMCANFGSPVLNIS